MISTCTRRDNWWTNIGSLDFVLRPELEENLEIRRHESYDLNGLKKNNLWTLWKSAPELLRQEDTTNPGFIMWGCKNISGGGSPSVIVQEVREQLDWLADNPFYTKRFAYYVGRKCRTMTVKDVAKELKLDWHTVKALDKEYMQKQLQRNPIAAPGVVGIDERSLRRGHTYRIVVSDLERGRPIWYGGEDRSEESPDMFYEWLGPKKMKKIRLAVTDMWKAFKKSTKRNVPQAAILFDKFHIFLFHKSI